MYTETKNMKDNPRTKTNFLSKLTFAWVAKLFYIRSKRKLNLDDLFKPSKIDESAKLGSDLEKYWEEELIRAEAKREQPNLMKALNRMFLGKLICCGLLVLLFSLLAVAQPVLLANLLRLIEKSSSGLATVDDRQMKYIYGGAIVITTMLKVLLYNHHLAFHYLLGMQYRIACSALLYRKVMRLNHSSVAQITAGQLINFLSNDAIRFDFGLPWINFIWVMPLQVALGLYLIWREVGISSLAGVITMFVITIPVQGFLGVLSSKYRLKVANRSDTRVKHMTELINGIQVIKMYAWEKPFDKIIHALRRYEVKAIRASSFLKAVYLSFIVFTDRLSSFATILCYTLLGYHIGADQVFSLAQFLNVMQVSMAVGFPLAINMGAEILVSIKRLEELMGLKEKEKSKIVDDYKDPNASVVLKNVDAAWTPNEWRLSNININIPTGSLCVIVGSVGSGKSSILSLILGELIPSSGTIRKAGEISYASQEPWLFVGSVRDNILFGQPYIRERYREVVRVCALEKDFQLFPYGDRTLVGERGVSLSGGQRARINLARAVYRTADIYLLDDPLSAVDTHVSKHLFQECITDYLGKKTRILVTHQLQFLNRADLIIVVDDGKIVSQGTYHEISMTNLDIKQLLHLDDKEGTEKEEKEDKELKEQTKLSRKESTRSTASTVNGDMEMETHEEEMSKSAALFWPYFRASGHICKFIILVFLLVASQAVLNASDIVLTWWISTNPDPNDPSNNNSTEVVFQPLGKNGTSSDMTNYNYQTNLNNTADIKKFFTNNSFYIYATLIILTVFLTFIRSLWFMMTCMKASINLHNRMFSCLMRSVMRFFDNNPSGRILNRFSKDIGTMDEILPKTMLEAIQVMLVMTGILIVIIISNYYMAIAIVIMLFIGFKLASIYTKTAKDIKRIEGITKSPVFSHVKASYDGLTTIRACEAQNYYINEFDMLQDVHTSAWYLTVVSRSAFGVYIDFCTVIFIAAVIFSFIYLNEVFSFFDASKAGLAISQAMILTGMVQLGSQQATEVVNQMMSVERILEYTNLEKESDEGSDQKDLPIWPSKGHIKFKNMFLRYQLNDPPVLKNLNFSILPGQKVGIVGRTGAGKSSIISALFLLSTIEGNIYIDDVDTKKVNLSLLRSKISIIPQKPVLFSSSVRDNLDPFNEYKDDEIWSAIDEVEMKSCVPSLEYMVQEGGINFSVGQRQLLCLARAILRNNRVLVLDEATANVDHQTDSLIQTTIRKKFGNCTVLTIAHRLNTIMDSDIIFVMHAGELVESGHPHKLLQNFNGYFFKLVADNEESEAKRLHSIANQTYLNTLKEDDEVTNL